MEAAKDRAEDLNRMVVRPVGVVRSPLQDPVLRVGPRGLEHQGDRAGGPDTGPPDFRYVTSEIQILPGFEDLLDGVDGFSHLLVVFWAHRVPPEGRTLKKVHPMGMKEYPAQGIFATCSPARPNPLLVNAVELVRRDGNVLSVTGLEAVDGSPVVDLKPYVPLYFRVDAPVRLPEWMERILRRFAG